MLEAEAGAGLATWQLPVWPITAATPARRLPDHRREYLNYEGPVSGGRGSVRRVEGGLCDIARPRGDRWEVLFDSGYRISLTHEARDAWVCRPAAN